MGTTKSTLFPYTTLFRSHLPWKYETAVEKMTMLETAGAATRTLSGATPRCRAPARQQSPTWSRSEEHTSELQSRENLVCRPRLVRINTEKGEMNEERIMQ